MAAMDLSIIIVNWKVRDLLRACLDSIYAEAEMPREQFEVVVVDNDSRDGSVEMVRNEFPQVRLIPNADNPGFGRANNQGLTLCSGRYVLLLNPDTVVLDHGLDRMVRHLDANPGISVLGCRLLNGDRTLQRWTGGAFISVPTAACHYLFLDKVLPRALRPRSLYLDGDVAGDVDVDWISGAVMLLRREHLAQGMFDESFFMYGEDMELCSRMGRLGRVVYSPVASIIHYQGASMAQQSGEVMLSSLKGPRAYYRLRHGGTWVWAIDLITAAGFAVRWAAYTAMAPLRRGCWSKARSSQQYLIRSLRIMGGG
jgi:N-acetylglucosaminyl-diphospho-decaprenol L-rhamnosyltransferase